MTIRNAIKLTHGKGVKMAVLLVCMQCNVKRDFWSDTIDKPLQLSFFERKYFLHTVDLYSCKHINTIIFLLLSLLVGPKSYQIDNNYSVTKLIVTL